MTATAERFPRERSEDCIAGAKREEFRGKCRAQVDEFLIGAWPQNCKCLDR
jgi:hypothetical protein